MNAYRAENSRFYAVVPWSPDQQVLRPLPSCPPPHEVRPLWESADSQAVWAKVVQNYNVPKSDTKTCAGAPQPTSPQRKKKVQVELGSISISFVCRALTGSWGSPVSSPLKHGHKKRFWLGCYEG